MRLYLIILLLSCSICFSLDSCYRKQADNAALPIKQKSDSLIAAGKNYLSGPVDSLLSIAGKLAKASQSSGYKDPLVYANYYKGVYYWQKGNHKASMQFAVTSLAYADKWHVKRALPYIYQLIGNLHKENANYKLAFASADKGIDVAQALKDTAGLVSLLGLKAMFIHSYGFDKRKTYLDTSINLQIKALNLAQSRPAYQKLCTKLYDNIGQYYLDTKKDYDKTILFCTKGAESAIKNGQQRSLTYSYAWLGLAWYYKGDHNKGMQYLYKALQVARNLKEPYRVMEIYGHMYDCYFFSGDFKNAIAVGNISRKMHDSLQVISNEKQLEELQIKYESVKKDRAIAVLDNQEHRKDKVIILILFAILLSGMMWFVLFKRYNTVNRKKRQIETSNNQKDTALKNIAFIQSHELRKPLASILGLVNVIRADEYVTDPECLMKLEEATNQLDEIIHEIIREIESN